MKIQFPLWLVTNPGPRSEMADVCTELPDFECAARVLSGLRPFGRSPSTRIPVLYTDEALRPGCAVARVEPRLRIGRRFRRCATSGPAPRLRRRTAVAS